MTLLEWNPNIIYSKRRKTIALEIKEGKLIVRAPLYTSLKKIETLILKHHYWIGQTIDKQVLSIGKRLQNKSLRLIFYLGEPHKIVYSDTQNKIVDLKNKTILIKTDYRESTYAVLKNWYKDQAYKLVLPKISFYAKKYHLSYETVKITYARKRWGSCSHFNRISFSYMIAMLPNDVMDYIVVHELSHTLYKNHSTDFWNQVACIMPNYKEKEAWLSNHSEELFLIE